MRTAASEIARLSLEELVRELNNGPDGWSKPEAHPKLLQLLRAWREATVEWAGLVRAWKASGSPKDSIPRPVAIKVPEGCPTVFEMQQRCKVLLTPDPRGGRWLPGVIYAGAGKGWTTWDIACSKFIPLMLNPEAHRLGGPCPYCGKVFVRTTEKRKRYCSKRCAHRAAAKASTRRLRAQAHAEKVDRVKDAIEKWRQKPRRLRWIPWVLAEIPDMKKSWLTRAINRQEITAPDLVTKGTRG